MRFSLLNSEKYRRIYYEKSSFIHFRGGILDAKKDGGGKLATDGQVSINNIHIPLLNVLSSSSYLVAQLTNEQYIISYPTSFGWNAAQIVDGLMGIYSR